MRTEIIGLEPEGIEKFINYTLSYQTFNPYHPVQVDVIDPQYYEEFLELCHSLQEYEFIDELSGGWARKRSKTLKFEDVIHKADTGIKCGMTVIHSPQYNMEFWENWEGGYIECFIRMDSDTKGNEWFIWQYIRMNHLNQIVEKMGDKLSYFYLPLTQDSTRRV